jgi:hypothetical protein
MKQNLVLGCIGLALLVSGLAFAQGGGAPRPEEKIERLERDLVESQKRVEKLSQKLADQQVEVARIVRYLEQQAESSKALATALDQSEAAGFTFGINPESRHILLRGWREHLAVLQKDVPSLPDGAKPKNEPAGEAPAQR